MSDTEKPAFLSIVSDGSVEGTRVIHSKAGDIQGGLSRCEIVIDEHGVRAILTYEGVELGLTLPDKPKNGIPGHRPLAPGGD